MATHLNGHEVHVLLILLNSFGMGISPVLHFSGSGILLDIEGTTSSVRFVYDLLARGWENLHHGDYRIVP